MNVSRAGKYFRRRGAALVAAALLVAPRVAQAQAISGPPPAGPGVEAAPAPLEAPAPGSAEPAADGAGGATEEATVELSEMRIQGQAVKNSVATERRNAAVTVDLITKHDMSRFVASDVADVIVRMPGLSSTSRGSFAVVRGLAERYNPILLDGIVLPSSDPEKQTPELDIFPTRLVDAIVVNKVFDPRLPATSSGGAVDLRTKPLPEGRFAQLQFGLRADGGFLAGDPFLSSDTPGRWDLVALGAKDRPRAPATPEGKVALAKDPATNWIGEDSRYPIGTRFSVVFEDRIELGESGRALGYALSLGYDSFASTEQGRVFRAQVPFGSPGIAYEDGSLRGEVSGEDYARYEQEARVGGLFTVGLAFNPEHSVGLSVFLSQIGKEDVTQIYNGFSGLNSGTVDQLEMLYRAFDSGEVDPRFAGVSGAEPALTQSESLHYRQRNLTDVKLSGEHRWEGLRRAKLDWSVARISTNQEEPDFSFLPYLEYFPPIAGIDPFLILYGQPIRLPTRYWRDVNEDSWAGRMDGDLEFRLGWMDQAVARAGFYLESTGRAYRQDAYTLTGGQSSTGTTLPGLVASLQGVNFASVGRGLGLNPAAADAERKLSAAYLSASLPVLEGARWIRNVSLLLGARVERYEFAASGRGTFGNAASADYYITPTVQQKLPPGSLGPVNLPETVYSRDLDESTVHPAVALNWSPRERMNVRLAYAETIARPSFRETGPYFTSDEVTNEIQHGNVFLNTSRVENLDFRVEYFIPNSRDLMALSLFRKTIGNPIEKQADVITGSGFTALGWFNNPDSAHLEGIEVEVARSLGFLGELGSRFTVGGNATFIAAESTVLPGEFGVPGTKRSLYDQPEWIGNAHLTFDHARIGFSATISWFAISDVLRNTSTETWATYVESHERIDLNLAQRLGRQWLARLTVRNLTDPVRRFIADPGAADSVTYRSFNDGRTYSLSLTCDF